MTRQRLLACVLAFPLLAAGSAQAATASYEYDALGRLTRITYSDGKVVIYRLDSAGNRKHVVSGTLPGVPASISVPSSSTTGSYAINWGAATGTVTAYKLYEATNASFTGDVLVYDGTALSASLSGRGNGAYHYRVQACLDTNCSAYRTGANGVTVSLATSIQVLNPSLAIGPTTTPITTLATLNGNPATIHSFSETCSLASASIESGAQSVV